MAKRTITSASSQFILGVDGVLAVPTPLQGYAVDDAFTTDAIEAAQTQLGVDGLMSGGFTPFLVPLTVHLQADSPSILVFDAWLGAMEAATEVFYGQASIVIPSIGKSYIFNNGVLVRAMKLPSARKVLAPVTYAISWESVNPADI